MRKLLGSMVALAAGLSLAHATSHMVAGEVKKIDLSAKKITVRHDEIKSLDMPAMTMVFQVSDPSFLGKLKVGDKFKFAAERVGGALTITAIEKGK